MAAWKASNFGYVPGGQTSISKYKEMWATIDHFNILEEGYEVFSIYFMQSIGTLYALQKLAFKVSALSPVTRYTINEASGWAYSHEFWETLLRQALQVNI